MKNQHTFTDTVDQIVTDGVKRGILHLYTSDKSFEGNQITLKDRPVINFGSCSYLGLEFDDRLKKSSQAAVENFGTQFSESRAYVSATPYLELEQLFEQIFGLPVVITPTTTLGHIASIPVLVSDDDAVIMDHQVHSSVQTAVNLVKARGVHTELVRHNRMDLLELKIIQLRNKFKRIWYMADGIYSMFGDKCPVHEVACLMNKYPELNFYVDDAHGMSIYGKHGQGYVLSEIPHHPRMYVATSLAKAFATGGAVMVYPDRESARRVRTCGGPLITSGPLQPAVLGAAIASAKIHLSGEINAMQEELLDNIRFTNLMLKKNGLPVISESDAAVFFIGVSLPGLGYNLIKRMLNRGYYLNLGIFPAVPMKNTGIRFTITRLHSFEQIENMVSTLAAEFKLAMREEGIMLKDIYRAFKLPMPETVKLDRAVDSVIKQSLYLTTESATTITDLDMAGWDRLFAGKGCFDAAGLRFLESTFSGNAAGEDNWKFDYFIVRDQEGQPVVATFFTTALWKDDMLSPAEISAMVEQKRMTDPYYLTSKVISAGSLLTEGEHIYINRQSPQWKDAMLLMFDKIAALQDAAGADTVVLRDFRNADEELSAFLIDNGYFKVAMPVNNTITGMSWQGRDGFYNQLSKRSMRHFRQDVARFEDQFETAVIKDAAEERLLRWYNMYCQVKNRNLGLNTFTLPYKIFSAMAAHPSWDIVELRLKNRPDSEPAAVLFSYVSGGTYVSVMIGLDYTVLMEYRVYRQSLYRLVMRARELGCNHVHLGFSAQVEKKKVGAVQSAAWAFMQVKDSYNMQELSNMAVSTRMTG